MGSGKKAEAARTSKKSKALERAAAEFADVATETDESGHVRKRDYSYTQNRELSWLMFDNRVMDEAFDPEVPLFERLKFCEIFDSNLEEWFMIRVGGLSDLATLKNQPKDNKSHKTPAGQLDAIFEALPPLVERHAAGFAQVETPYLYCTAVGSLPSGSFTNVADAGGVYNGQWVQAVSRWVTTVYGKPEPLPRTGY